MRVRVFKKPQGKFDILFEPGRRSGMAKLFVRDVAKKDIESVVKPELQRADEIRDALRAAREPKPLP